MVLDEERVRERLNSPLNLANRFSSAKSIEEGPKESVRASPPLPPPQGMDESEESSLKLIPFKEGLGRHRPPLPDEVRDTIAILAHGNEGQKEIAKEFGVSQAEVSCLKTGRARSNVRASIERVQEKAIERLMESLGLLTNEKIEKCNAVNISAIASNLAKVVNQTSPGNLDGSGVNLVVYAPQVRDEKYYKSVEVS